MGGCPTLNQKCSSFHLGPHYHPQHPTNHQASLEPYGGLVHILRVRLTWQVMTQSAIILDKFPELETLRLMHNWINHSTPRLGNDCWLCLDPRPPFYARIGVNYSITPTITPPVNYDYGPEEAKLTLGELQGTGTYFLNL